MGEANKKKKVTDFVYACSCVFCEHGSACWSWEMFTERERVCLYFLSTQSALSLVPLRSLLSSFFKPSTWK